MSSRLFECNYELAWNILKDFYEYQGEQNIQGSPDAIKVAFRRGLISDADVWMKMIKSRTLTVHTYNEDVTQMLDTYQFTGKEPLRETVFAALDNKPKLLERKNVFKRIVDRLLTIVRTFDDGMGDV